MSVKPHAGQAVPRTQPLAQASKLPPARLSAAIPVPASDAASTPTDQFFRQIVTSMRTGVLAITQEGRVAVMNGFAYRILNIVEQGSDIGRPFGDVLGSHRELARILATAFELTHLPNRAEVRLKTSGKSIGYTLSHVRDAANRVTGAALFFKDLTRVEQLEERERLRDRLAALGEMAAAIAHEVKNPLAGIEVMAGVLRRQLPDSTDAQNVLTDIINEAKMANAIVVEVLQFVRPLRLQVERVDVLHLLRDAVATSHANSDTITVALDYLRPSLTFRPTATSFGSSSRT